MKKALLVSFAALAIAAQAQPSACSSDGVPAPSALLERFTSADCDHCWNDPKTPDAASGTVAVDWVVEGSKGDDSPLAAVATRDGADRLEASKRQMTDPTATRFTARTDEVRTLRVAHGVPIADYVGTSIELAPAGKGPWRVWLLLVENLPAGTEGSPVERNLVRNSFTAEWPAAKSAAPRRYELRPMRIAEGTKPSRLRAIGWVEDAQGKLRAIAQSRCASR